MSTNGPYLPLEAEDEQRNLSMTPSGQHTFERIQFKQTSRERLAFKNAFAHSPCPASISSPSSCKNYSVKSPPLQVPSKAIKHTSLRPQACLEHIHAALSYSCCSLFNESSLYDIIKVKFQGPESSMLYRAALVITRSCSMHIELNLAIFVVFDVLQSTPSAREPLCTLGSFLISLTSSSSLIPVQRQS